MNAPVLVAETAMASAAVEVAIPENGLYRPSDEAPDYRVMIKSLYFPPLPECFRPDSTST